RPDVPGRIDTDAVRDLVEALAPGTEHAALAVDGDNGVGLVAALQEVDDTFGVARDRRDHLQLPAGSRGPGFQRRAPEGEPRAFRDGGAQSLRLRLEVGVRRRLRPQGQADQHEAGTSYHRRPPRLPPTRIAAPLIE